MPYEYGRGEVHNYGRLPGGGSQAGVVPGGYPGGNQGDWGYGPQTNNGLRVQGGIGQHPSNFRGRGGQDRDGGPRY